MDNLTYLMSERSRARKQLKNYFYAFRDEIAKDFNVELPTKEEIKAMPKKAFDEFIVSIISRFMETPEKDFDLIEMLEFFIICDNKVRNADVNDTVNV